MRLQTTEVLSTLPYVRPSSLINLARLKHGVAYSYSSAWRALQCHRQDINKADVISFGQIPYFLHEIEIANSGSTTYVAATSEAKPFQRSSSQDVFIVHGLGEMPPTRLQRTISLIRSSPSCVWHLEKERQYDIQIQFGGTLGGSKGWQSSKHVEAMTLMLQHHCLAAEYLKNANPNEWQEALSCSSNLDPSPLNSADLETHGWRNIVISAHLGILDIQMGSRAKETSCSQCVCTNVVVNITARHPCRVPIHD
ncbi:hypothetical protein BASA60_006856 [Batrachochytrium salamandrivorans]|nr:hypothetical protein BASA60_006856 [Batrachochytrium salamandrivorans]